MVYTHVIDDSLVTSRDKKSSLPYFDRIDYPNMLRYGNDCNYFADKASSDELKIVMKIFNARFHTVLKMAIPIEISDAFQRVPKEHVLSVGLVYTEFVFFNIQNSRRDS